MKKPSKNPATPISSRKASTAASAKRKQGAMDDFGQRVVENLNRNVRNNEPTN
jgi:hypothetical protein